MVIETLREMNIGFQAGERGVEKQRSSLVMIHGAGGRAQFWQNQVRFLDGAVNPIALDLPGHGKTPGGGEKEIEGYAAWLARVLEKVFDGPVFLMGHSMGGAIVQEMALGHPQLLKSAILVATGAKLSVAPAFLDGIRSQFDETVDTIIRYSYASDAGEAMIKLGASMMKETESEILYGDFLACDRFDRRADLNKIRVPCLILCGEKDKMTPPSLSEELHKGIPGSVLKRIPSAGHMVMIERYREVNRSVQDFLMSNPP